MAGTDGVAEKWRELSGENNWVGLLDPLDIDLRRYIIHYGERTAAVGDAYTDETVVSKRNRTVTVTRVQFVPVIFSIWTTGWCCPIAPLQLCSIDQ
ncbi:hypothetical protein QYF36_014140 [Acer negundo]|nr:hypothetical protein QYF36_014140 [Acer negundo]